MDEFACKTAKKCRNAGKYTACIYSDGSRCTAYAESKTVSLDFYKVEDGLPPFDATVLWSGCDPRAAEGGYAVQETTNLLT
jgi:hypothetical protein